VFITTYFKRATADKQAFERSRAAVVGACDSGTRSSKLKILWKWNSALSYKYYSNYWLVYSTCPLLASKRAT